MARLARRRWYAENAPVDHIVVRPVVDGIVSWHEEQRTRAIWHLGWTHSQWRQRWSQPFVLPCLLQGESGWKRLPSKHTWLNSVHRLEKAAVHFMSELRMLLGLHGNITHIGIDGILCARSTAYLPILMALIVGKMCMMHSLIKLLCSVRSTWKYSIVRELNHDPHPPTSYVSPSCIFSNVRFMCVVVVVVVRGIGVVVMVVV